MMMRSLNSGYSNIYLIDYIRAMNINVKYKKKFDSNLFSMLSFKNNRYIFADEEYDNFRPFNNLRPISKVGSMKILANV